MTESYKVSFFYTYKNDGSRAGPTRALMSVPYVSTTHKKKRS